MKLSRNEHTIAEACEVDGCGYWTGDPVRVRMLPAPVGTGIEFIRTDLPGQPNCVASVANRHDTQLRTILRKGEARFEMIEHLMAALYALEIDNCRVEVDGVEFPGLDGSSDAFVEALRRSGLIIQAKQRDVWVVDQTLRVEAGDRWIQVEPHAPGSSYRGAYFEYRLRFDHESPIPDQTFGFECTPSSYISQVASARTFVTLSQAESLRAQGVARHVTNQDLLVFGADGPIENKLRYPDECARHKTLDLIGDLALTGFELVGRVISFRGGHSLNGLLAERLLGHIKTTSRSISDQSQYKKAA